MYRDIPSSVITLFVYVCLTFSVLPARGCPGQVELSVDEEGLEASIKMDKERIISDAAFRPSLEQLSGAISVNSFSYLPCTDFTLNGDTVLMVRDNGAISAFEKIYFGPNCGHKSLGNLTPPGIPQYISYDGNVILILCDGAWYRTYVTWGKGLREYMPNWMDGGNLAEGIQEVR